ncbi:MAG: oligosaccharide flippase family protein [Geminicoccaceae bacterium]|nr:oligosaccharide flippase family protein [Geminicoccaceae bacterium]
MNGHGVARSVVWAALESGLSLAVSTGSVLVLARLLGAAEFGLGSLAHGLVQIPLVVVGSLVHDALVQKEDLAPAELRAGRFGSLLAGFGFALFTLASAPLLASAFAEPRLSPLLCALAPLLVLESATAPLLALRRRALAFATVARRLLAGRAIGAAAGVLAAVSGLGAASIVVQQLVASGAILILFGRDAPRLPGVPRQGRAFFELVRFCRPIVGVQLLIQGGERLFIAYVGHRLGLAAAGHWSLAIRLVENIAGVVSTALYHVGLAFMSRLQHDRAALSRRLEEAVDLLMLAVVPAVAALIVVADLLLLLVVGGEWLAAAVAVQLLALGALFSMRRLLPTVALTATGQPRANLDAYLAENLPTLALLFLWGPTSILGVATLRAGRALFGWAVIALAARRSLARPLGRELGAVSLDLAALGGGLLVGTLVRFALAPHGWAPWFLLALAATAAAVAAAAVLLALRPGALRTLAASLPFAPRSAACPVAGARKERS